MQNSENSKLGKIIPLKRDSFEDCVRLGHISYITDDGEIYVSYRNNPYGPLYARSTVMIGQDDIEREILLVFEENDLSLPVIVGLIQDSPVQINCETNMQREKIDELKMDGEKVVLNAEKEIELRCGKSSLIMKKDGKVVIKGDQILSRASKVNKIKGAAVQIN